MGTQGKAGAVKVDPQVHTRFKSACPLHGKQMQEAATEALAAMLLWWKRGRGGDFVAFVDLVTMPDTDMAMAVELLEKAADYAYEADINPSAPSAEELRAVARRIREKIETDLALQQSASVSQTDGDDEAMGSVEEAQACEGAGAAIAALWKLIQEDEQKEGGQ